MLRVGIAKRRRMRYWRPLSHGRPAWERLVLQVGRWSLSLVSVPAGGWFCSSIRKGSGSEWIKLAVPDLEELDMKRVKVGEPATPGAASHLAPVESDIFVRLMSLVSHCAVLRYEDGEVRQPGWFTVKTLGSSWVVQVKDPDSCCSLQAIGATLDDALTLAELLLSSDQAPWEADRFLQGQQAARKKK